MIIDDVDDAHTTFHDLVNFPSTFNAIADFPGRCHQYLVGHGLFKSFCRVTTWDALRSFFVAKFSERCATESFSSLSSVRGQGSALHTSRLRVPQKFFCSAQSLSNQSFKTNCPVVWPGEPIVEGKAYVQDSTSSPAAKGV